MMVNLVDPVIIRSFQQEWYKMEEKIPLSPMSVLGWYTDFDEYLSS